MDEPVFHEPWHAQIFAITVHLNQSGLFDWPHWTQRFGATLKEHGLSKELDGGQDYFNAWLETLENVLRDKDIAAGSEIGQLVSEWREAYLSTPHGQPVKLKA